jgi:formamidopyrimidine-DNA glycosylase
MPELPDVAGFKKYLDATALHKRITATECFDERFVKGVSRRKLQRRLKGQELTGSVRHGKWLFAPLSEKGVLVLHFGMTGQLDFGGDDGEPPEHTRLLLHMEKGKRLAILSQRMIGRASVSQSIEEVLGEHEVGVDALSDELDADAFVELLAGRRGAIKSALMNQSVVAGIGNVYSDEILFQAGLHPASKIRRMDRRQLTDLHRVMRRVLKTAADKGGDGRKAPRSWLLGRRGPDELCPRCGGEIEPITVSGRRGWYCPSCQPKP